MGKISKKTCKKFIFVMLFIVLITLVGIFFYRNREGLEVNKVGTATGGWGGSCTCPDGQVYQVSDNGTSGRELACYGGVSGKVNRFSGPWSGKSVTCAPKVKDSEPKGQTLKDYVYNSVNQKITDLKRLYNCQVGYGTGSSHTDTNSNSYESCAKDCDQNKNCKAFDFTTMPIKNGACRLYNDTDPPHLGNGGSHNRQYCLLNQKLTDLKRLYNCQVGQGKSGTSYSETSSNSYESCAKDCDQNKDCKAFDYTINSSKVACRLYNNTDSPRLGIGGGDNRQYCLLIK